MMNVVKNADVCIIVVQGQLIRLMKMEFALVAVKMHNLNQALKSGVRNFWKKEDKKMKPTEKRKNAEKKKKRKNFPTASKRQSKFCWVMMQTELLKIECK